MPSAPAPAGVVLSDSLPPVAVSLKMDRCPDVAMNSPAIVACSARQLGSAVAVNGASQRLSLLITAASIPELVCPIGNAEAAPVSMSVTIAADFGTPRGYATLECELINAENVSLARTTVPLSVSATEWPLWDDALIAVPSTASTGALLVRSVRCAATSNATAQLLAAYCRDASVNCSFAEALDSADAVLAAVIAAWEATPPPPLPAVPQAFTATIVGAQMVVLRSSAAHTPAFFPGVTTITIGGISCTVRAVSRDGAWLLVAAPPPAELCGSAASGDCGYVTLVSNNAPSLRRQLASSASALPPDRGAALACPPFCPGSVGLDIPFAVVASGQATAPPSTPGPPYVFVRASRAAGASALPVLAPVAPALSPPSQGFYYAAACDASGFFESPALGACANASDPRSFYCAWGAGTSCSPCPRAALCPGGFRLWSRPGHWLASESSPPSDVSACAPPDPAARCVGWDALTGATTCGVGYRQGSYLCTACAPGFHTAGDSTCLKCPASAGLWARYEGAVYIVAAIGATIVLFAALLYFVTWLAARDIWSMAHLWRLLHLGVWAFTSAQVRVVVE